MQPDTVLALKRCWEDEQKKEDKGEETFKKDPELPTKHYDAGPDNCADLLHPTRYGKDYTKNTQPETRFRSVYSVSGTGTDQYRERIILNSSVPTNKQIV